MIRCNRQVFLSTFFVLGFYLSAHSEVTTWYDDSLHPCLHDSVLITETIERLPSGAVQRTTLTVLGMSREFTGSPNQLQSREFINQVLVMASLQCGSGGVANLPAAAAAAAFEQTVFTRQARPRLAAGPSTPLLKRDASAAGTGGSPETEAGAARSETPAATGAGKAVALAPAKKETGTRPTLPPNNITTDLELDFFKQDTISGRNFAVHAGYSRTLANDKFTCGGSLIVNTMLMLNRTFFNNALNINGAWMFSESSTLERKAGGSVNAFLVDRAFYGTPFGMSIVANISDNWFVNQDNILTYGIMGQQSFAGEVKTTLITAGMLYGLPIGGRFALNVSSLYSVNVLAIGSEGKLKTENPMMFQPAVNGSVYFTRLFSLDMGWKTTLLVKDYSDLILTLGTVMLF